jgi:hypothetical protein
MGHSLPLLDHCGRQPNRAAATGLFGADRRVLPLRDVDNVAEAMGVEDLSAGCEWVRAEQGERD